MQPQTGIACEQHACSGDRVLLGRRAANENGSLGRNNIHLALACVRHSIAMYCKSPKRVHRQIRVEVGMGVSRRPPVPLRTLWF